MSPLRVTAPAVTRIHGCRIHDDVYGTREYSRRTANAAGMNIIPADYFSLRISPFRRILARQP
jgi:hypothetical protein